MHEKEISEELQKRRKSKNMALLVVLLAFVFIFYGLSIVKMS